MNATVLGFLGWLILAVYALLIFLSRRARWATNFRLSKNREVSAEVKAIKAKLIEAEVFSIVERAKDTKDKAGDVLRDKVYRAIDYSIKRHDWYEDQRSRVLTIILTIGTLALTLAGILLKGGSSSKLEIGHCLPLFTTVLITLLGGLHYYNSDLDQDRPYRLLSDIRFWFFRYNLPLRGKMAGEQDGDIEKAGMVKLERDEFFNRTVGSFSIEASLREDVEQLFILHLLQRSKTESLTALRRIMSYSVPFLAMQMMLMLLE